MDTSTDFIIFLNEIEDLEEAFCLDQTIRTGSDYGYYHYKEKDGKIFITSDSWNDTLMLANEKSKDYFLHLLEKEWSKDNIQLEVYYEMMRQMSKED